MSTRRRTLLAGLLALPAASQAAAPGLETLQRLAGDWQGSASGRSGEGQVRRSYRWLMGSRYLQESNATRYVATDSRGARAEELHEHWAMFSFDSVRQLIVLRQFHAEGFVNSYRCSSPAGQWPLVFDSEAFENLGAGWRARESLEWAAGEELVERFELAAPGRDYELYSQSRLRRTKSTA